MLPDGGGEFQHVQILQDVWDWHQAENSEKSEANTRPVQENADKHWWDGEVVNKGSNLKHEVKFIIGSHELNKMLMSLSVRQLDCVDWLG